MKHVGGRGMFGRVLSGQTGNWSRYQQKLFERTGTSGWHRHDLRRTAATILGRHDLPPHVVEVVLGHAHPHSALAGVYNKARYENEHREALKLLAGYYAKIIAQ